MAGLQSAIPEVFEASSGPTCVKIAPLGIDLATRGFERFLGKLEPCLIGTEGCPPLRVCPRWIAAWLGFVPRQKSPGCQERLERASSIGKDYLRQLPVFGTYCPPTKCAKHRQNVTTDPDTLIGSGSEPGCPTSVSSFPERSAGIDPDGLRANRAAPSQIAVSGHRHGPALGLDKRFGKDLVPSFSLQTE